MRFFLLVLGVVCGVGGCAPLPEGGAGLSADAPGALHRARAAGDVGGEARAVHALVDSWHDAAARGDLDAYFGRMTDDAVFLGTDDTERWGREAFLAFARPYFDGPTAYGEGAWTYMPAERFVMFDASGRVAWFDERLDHATYGRCRGTGVCERGGDGAWRVAHYSLTFPVPNDVAEDVIGVIRGYENGAASGE